MLQFLTVRERVKTDKQIKFPQQEKDNRVTLFLRRIFAEKISEHPHDL